MNINMNALAKLANSNSEKDDLTDLMKEVGLSGTGISEAIARAKAKEEQVMIEEAAAEVLKVLKAKKHEVEQVVDTIRLMRRREALYLAYLKRVSSFEEYAVRTNDYVPLVRLMVEGVERHSSKSDADLGINASLMPVAKRAASKK